MSKLFFLHSLQKRVKMSIELLHYKQSRIYELKCSYQQYLERLTTILGANIKTVKKTYIWNDYQKTQTINELVTQYYKDSTNLENALNINIEYISNLD